MCCLEKPIYIMICHWDLRSSGVSRNIVCYNYQSTLHEIAEDQRSHLHRAWNHRAFSAILCVASFLLPVHSLCLISSSSLSSLSFCLSPLVLYGNLIMWYETSKFLWYLKGHLMTEVFCYCERGEYRLRANSCLSTTYDHLRTFIQCCIIWTAQTAVTLVYLRISVK